MSRGRPTQVRRPRALLPDSPFSPAKWLTLLARPDLGQDGLRPRVCGERSRGYGMQHEVLRRHNDAPGGHQLCKRSFAFSVLKGYPRMRTGLVWVVVCVLSNTDGLLGRDKEWMQMRRPRGESARVPGNSPTRVRSLAHLLCIFRLILISSAKADWRSFTMTYDLASDYVSAMVEDWAGALLTGHTVSGHVVTSDMAMLRIHRSRWYSKSTRRLHRR